VPFSLSGTAGGRGRLLQWQDDDSDEGASPLHASYLDALLRTTSVLPARAWSRRRPAPPPRLVGCQSSPTLGHDKDDDPLFCLGSSAGPQPTQATCRRRRPLWSPSATASRPDAVDSRAASLACEPWQSAPSDPPHPFHCGPSWMGGRSPACRRRQLHRGP
jgi:hypothetical protein